MEPLPLRLAPLYAGHLQVFSDASQKRHGGLAAVLFATPDSEALVRTRAVPIIGSNELELQATLFALEQARDLFPDRPLALFSDNQDAVHRLNRSKTEGLEQDPELRQMLDALDLLETLAKASICWIKGHGSCRGNILADQHAAEAAS
ncbi:MAG: RNase H family protein [Azonexus sp.]|nr:RNase H family protein [Azonexus sp.]